MIEFKNVYKRYKKNDVLLNTNVHIQRGEIAYLIGESGAGKSTIINLLTKHEKLTDGRIIVDGVDISKIKRAKHIQKYRREIGIVFQDYKLIQEMTVKENLKSVLEYLGFKRKDITNKIKSISDELGISHLLNKKVETLSGGEQQRVAIARAIINNPKILLADEPTGNLDPRNKADVLDIFEKINKERGTTILIVTHDLDIAFNSDNKVYSINNGILVNEITSMG